MKVTNETVTKTEFCIYDNQGHKIVGFTTQAQCDLAVQKIESSWTQVYTVEFFSSGKEDITADVRKTWVTRMGLCWYQCEQIESEANRAIAKELEKEFYTKRDHAIMKLVDLLKAQLAPTKTG